MSKIVEKNLIVVVGDNEFETECDSVRALRPTLGGPYVDAAFTLGAVREILNAPNGREWVEVELMSRILPEESQDE